MPARKTFDGTVFWIKRPSAKTRHKIFSIVRAKRVNGQKSNFVTVKDDRIDAINDQFRSGQLKLDEANRQVLIIRDELIQARIKLSPMPTYTADNFQVFQDYFKKKYSRRIHTGAVRRPEVAEDDFLRGLRALGNLNLRTATIEKMQETIDASVSGNSQRKICGRINSLLAYLGRTEKLQLDPKEKPDPTYLTEQDFQSLKASINDPAINSLITVCFYAGLRPGEAYGLTLSQLISDDMLDIAWQAHWKTREQSKLKVEDKQRYAYIFPQGLEALKHLLDLSGADRERLEKGRDKSLAVLIKRHCSRLWPDTPMKHLTLKDFRHCYAKLMRLKGVSTGLMAQSMGNSEKVCEEYYVGRGRSEPSIHAIRQILKPSNINSS